MIRLVIIGATGTAAKRTLPALRGSAVCKVAAIHGRDSQRVSHLARAFGIPAAYVDVGQMLDGEAFDAVFVASPPFLHAVHVERACKTGRPVICEKPLAQSLEEARRIRETVEASRTPFMLAHHLRHQEAVVAIRESLIAAEIGDVVGGRGQWGFKLEADARNAVWKRDAASGGSSVFYDAGVHVVDLVVHLFGSPLAVSAAGYRLGDSAVVDNAAAILVYGSFNVVIDSSHDMPAALNDLVIFGNMGRIECPHAFSEESMRAITVQGKQGIRRVEFASVNLYRAEIENFLRRVVLRQRAIAGTTLYEAMESMTVLHAIDLSINERRLVELSSIHGYSKLV